MRTHFTNAPESALDAIVLPDLEIATRLDGEFDYLHLFVRTQAAMTASFPALKHHLRAGGMLWVSWPKGKPPGVDLTFREVIRIGYDHGLVESTTLSVDATWSAIKFTHPIPGKVYRNSYGQLAES